MFVAVGRCSRSLAIWQYVTRDLLLNKSLKDANELHLYFRVNSLFRDPNVLGRYLALAIVALGAWIAWRRPERQAIAGALVAAFLLVALAFTYSQTSFAALIAGLAVLVWLRFGAARFGAGRGLAIATVAVMAAVGVPSDDSIRTRARRPRRGLERAHGPDHRRHRAVRGHAGRRLGGSGRSRRRTGARSSHSRSRCRTPSRSPSPPSRG